MSARKQTQTETATFVFKGTIKKLKSATMKEVPVDSNTAIVKVDQIIEAASDLAGYAGSDITVQLSGKRKVKPGEQLIFHTVSWLYGETVAVRSLREETIKASHSAMLSAVGDPVERRRQKQQRQLFDDADLVLSGTVVAVRLPSDEMPAKKGAVSGAGTTRKPISEHDPKWREAVVEVDDVHKGDHKKKQVVVRFPASTDVMWYNAPKFHAGQQGHFILHKTKTTTRAATAKKKGAAAAPSTKPTDVYEALDPLDFQPYHESGGIKTIIDSESK